MEVTITTNAKDYIEMSTLKKALQVLATNVSKENLLFLADLSTYKDINVKLQKHKGKIKTAMILG